MAEKTEGKTEKAAAPKAKKSRSPSKFMVLSPIEIKDGKAVLSGSTTLITEDGRPFSSPQLATEYMDANNIAGGYAIVTVRSVGLRAEQRKLVTQSVSL